MDLALLVYAISLLSGIGKFFFTIIVLAVITAIANGLYWVDISSYNENYKEKVVAIKKRVWAAFWVGVGCAWALILLPSEKTAYTMVGAYAAQKVSENDKVQQMSGKVLTIIEQKLDSYIEDGIDEAKTKLDKAESNVLKAKDNEKRKSKD